MPGDETEMVEALLQKMMVGVAGQQIFSDGVRAWDEYARAAMVELFKAGFLVKEQPSETFCAEVAAASAEMADAMLVERKRRFGGGG